MTSQFAIHSRSCRVLKGIFLFAAFSSIADFTGLAAAQDAQLVKAIGITPKQDVDFEEPNPAQLKECKFDRTKSPSGFVVYHESGRILRRFLDTNGDGRLDQWSYFNNGSEVYREVDNDFDGKLDEYRWVGTTGSRWGLDLDQDGAIDRWKVISPEEVAFECFQAIKSRDQARFDRLLLSTEEFSSLGLGNEIKDRVEARLKNAREKFSKMASEQNAIGEKSLWIYAGNGQPAMLPAGGKNQRDLIIYENASGFFEGDASTQIALGSLVKIGDAWRMMELPELVDPSRPFGNGGAFFPMESFGGNAVIGTDDNENLAELYDQLATVEEQLENAKGRSIAKLEKSKADILVEFYEATKNQQSKRDWLENFADSVSSAFQAGRFKGGISYLNKFIASHKDSDGIDYVKWSSIFATYGWANSNGSQKQREKAYAKLIDELGDFQKEYPDSEFAADALIQIAVHFEVTDHDSPDKALQWYRRCNSRFQDTPYGRRAAGAIIRLGDKNESLPLSGTTASGKEFRLSSLRGKLVVLHFWETWCFPDDDIKELAKISAKYDDVVVVGCNIERGSLGSDGPDPTNEFKEFLKNHPDVTWVQLHAPGGVDGSTLAHQLGIATEPLVVLVDSKGKLAETNIGIGNLEREIERLRRKK